MKDIPLSSALIFQMPFRLLRIVQQNITVFSLISIKDMFVWPAVILVILEIGNLIYIISDILNRI